MANKIATDYDVFIQYILFIPLFGPGCSIMLLDPGFVTRYSSSHDLFLQSAPGEADAQEEVLHVD